MLFAEVCLQQNSILENLLKYQLDESVEPLAGPATMPPIFRPVQMTLVADRVTDFIELISALRHADNVSNRPPFFF